MQADLILHNGPVYTMDPRRPRAQAVAIQGAHVIAIGTDEEVRELCGPRTAAIDLAGRCLVPGFTDCHIHLAGYALSHQGVNLAGTRSLGEALARTAAMVSQTPIGEWVQGQGWDESEWQRPKLPTRWDLDRVSPHHAVVLFRKDGHLAWANSAALHEAGIGRATEAPPGGLLDRDEEGKPTGILRERAGELIRRAIPPPSREMLEGSLRRAIPELHRYGLTSVHIPEGPDEFRAYQRLREREELPLRVYMMLPAANLEALAASGFRTGFGDEKLRLGPVKFIADGSLGAETAEMLEAYEGRPGYFGVAVRPQEELRDMVERAAAAGLAVAIHAIGDGACHRVLDIFEALPADRNLRHRIEHAQLLHPEDIARLAKLGVIASMQAIHATSDMYIAEERWGARCRWGYAWKSLLSAGAHLAFGSDCPVETMNPLSGIHAAVTRQRPEGEPPGGWYREERLTVEEAVRAYTLGAAFASGEEKLKGSLAVGKLADLTVLSQDIFTIPPREILATEVELVVFDGQVVYEQGKL